MGAAQRRKGATAEREVATLLADRLGSEVVRNLEQTRGGGHDLLGVDPFAIEVKRCETLALPSWWRQACDQCPDDQVPALFYRQSRQPWRVILPLRYMLDTSDAGLDATFQVSIDGFCLIAREALHAA
jgi:hypothetical protein